MVGEVEVKRIVLLLACASLSLTACTAAAPPVVVGAPPPVVAPEAPASLVVIATRVEQAQGLYDRTKAFVDLFLPYMPASRAAQVRAAGAMVEKALMAARLATTLAGQKRAVNSIDTALAQFKFISGS